VQSAPLTRSSSRFASRSAKCFASDWADPTSAASHTLPRSCRCLHRSRNGRRVIWPKQRNWLELRVAQRAPHRIGYLQCRAGLQSVALGGDAEGPSPLGRRPAPTPASPTPWSTSPTCTLYTETAGRRIPTRPTASVARRSAAPGCTTATGKHRSALAAAR